MNLSPNWLVLIGLILNFTGALLISIEAIGATEFLQAINGNKKNSRFAKIDFTSSINTTFVFVLMWILTFLILLVCVDKFGVVEDLLIAPLGFFFWKLSIKGMDFIQTVLKSFAPPRSLSEKGIILLLVALIWGLVWGIIFLIISLIAIFIQFGIDLPLRFFSEKIIGSYVMRILKKIDRTVQNMQRWYFKKTVFVGAIFLLGGFLYQIIGIALIILRPES